MNTTIRSMVVLVAMLEVGACAHEPKGCQSSLNMPDVAAAMGEGVAIQPVFSGGGQKGWRLYNVHKSAQLTAHAVSSGTMMTHVCGIPASAVFVKGGDICCSVDATREIEVTLLVADQETKIRIKR